MIAARIFERASPDRPRHSEASVLRLPDGALLLAWSAFSATEEAPPGTTTGDPTAREWAHSRDNNPAEIRCRVSADEGLTWRGTRTLVRSDAGINVMQPALVHLPGGGIGLSYSERQSRYYARRIFRRSDDGVSWSPEVDVTGIDGYLTASNDRLVALSSGRVLPPLHQLFDGWIATRVAWSDDAGTSWSHSDPLEVRGRVRGALAGFWEASVAERPDGSLLLTGRTALGRIYSALSGDSGESWSVPAPIPIVAPSAPPLLRRLPAGRLALLHNTGHRPGELMQGSRSTLALSVSDDGGATWGRRDDLESDERRWFHYPSALVEGDRMFLSYSVTDPVTRSWRLATRWISLANRPGG